MPTRSSTKPDDDDDLPFAEEIVEDDLPFAEEIPEPEECYHPTSKHIHRIKFYDARLDPAYRISMLEVEYVARDGTHSTYHYHFPDAALAYSLFRAVTTATYPYREIWYPRVVKPGSPPGVRA